MKVTEVPAHTEIADAAMETLTGRRGLTVIVTLFEVAGLPVGHVAFEVKTHATISLLEGSWLKVALVAPVTLLPLTFHWYPGAVPPLTPVAVNVTEVPAQIGFSEAAIETLTGFNELTISVMELDVAGLPEVQGSLEVRIHFI